MNKLAIALILLLLPLMVFANAIPNHVAARPVYAPNIVKVQLTTAALNRTNLPEAFYAETAGFGLAELDKIMSRFGTGKVIRAHIRLNDKAWEKQHGVNRWFLVKFTNPIAVTEAVNAFKTSKYIETAIPEYYAYTQAIPNDTLYPNNWGHNNTAQLPYYTGGSHSGAGVGTIGFDSNAQAAWDDTQGYGSSSIIIAIIDTGVDTTHPDLRLVAGYDYGDNDANPMDDSGDPGHGTACSGVAAGVGNNALGVAGMAPGCSVMPLKIADSAGALGFTAIENALYHAGNNNVDVASMSFGASMAVGDSPSTDTALAFANSHGVVMLAATANANVSTIDYPSKYPNVIAVGAASPTGQRKSTTSSDGENWWGSNYGVNTQNSNDAVDIVAPTILPATDIVGAGGYDAGNYSMWFNGTSCATPYAAGVAALILSKSPSLTPAQVFTAMTTTATDMTADGGAGWDMYTGYGMVNAQGALASLTPGMPACSITSPTYGASYNLGDVVTINVTATDTAPGTISRVDFYLDGAVTPTYTDSSSPYAWAWNTTGTTGGNHTIEARAVDNGANTASSSVTISVMAPADEGFETGNFNAFTWAQSGNQPWTVQSTEKYSGTYAARSGVILASQTSTVAVSMNITTAGNITFYQKTSSESGYDYLRFYIDSVQQGQWSGEVAWTLQTYAVTVGAHEFKWTYSKDGSVDTGSDAAFIDHIIFPPHGVVIPATITWTPSSFTQSLATNMTASQNLTLGNTGNQTLNYTASLPTGSATVLDETFATTTIPTGWTQINDTGTTAWVFATGGYNNTHPSAAADGTYNARLYVGSTTAVVTKLVTPPLDMASATSGTLTFWHTQELWSPDQDELRVYYRTTAAGTWTLLSTYTASIATWTQETITLPSLTGTYYIGFQGTAKYGYGVCVDKVVVTKSSGSTAAWLSLNSGTTVSGSILSGGANQTIAVGFNTTGMANGTYNSTITVTSNSTTNSTITIPVTLTVETLAPIINVNPISLTYGTVLINTTTANTFTIVNSGNALLSGNITTPTGYAVSLVTAAGASALSLSPSQPAMGARSGGNTRSEGSKTPADQSSAWSSSSHSTQRNTLPYSVIAGGTNTYNLVFSPTAVQAYNGNVTIAHNAAGASKTIALTGQGGKPTIGLSATTFAANLAPGQTNSQTLNVSNSGNMALNYGLTIAGSPAWLTINSGTTVSSSIAVGGAAQNITVAFSSAGMSPGIYNATINGTSNDPSSLTYSITVTLTVRAPITLSAPAGGENWLGGSAQSIAWNYTGAGSSVTFSYSSNGGSAWTLVGSLPTAQGANNYSWTVPYLTSANCKVKLVDSISPLYTATSNVFTITAPTVIAPTFTPVAGTYSSAQTVTISTTTPSASIRYTTDGTDPSATVGTLYTIPISVSTSQTVKAIAYRSGWNNSSIATAAYVIMQTVATPTFTPIAGTYSSAQTVTISTTTPSASIRYTTDGTDPSATVGTLYTIPVSVSTSQTLKAIAYQTGWNNSSIATAAYVIMQTVVAPTFTPAAGTYSSAQTVSISTTTPGASIRYTTDGTDPSATLGTLYTIPVSVSTSQTVKAIAYQTGWNNSSIATAGYVIMQTVVAPTFTPTAGTYSSAQTVTISTTTPSASIRYTTDGTDPSATVGTLYTIPVSVSTSQTVKAIAYQTGWNNSSIATAGYVIMQTVATPTFTPAAGTYSSAQTVTISTTTSSASIRYTTDGTDPSATLGTLYTIPVNVSTSQTVKAIAYQTGWNNSSIATAIYTINIAPPSIPENVSITVSPLTGDVTICWDPATGNPSGYQIYKSTSPDFAPVDTILLGTRTAAETSLVLPAATLSPYAFFRVIAYRD